MLSKFYSYYNIMINNGRDWVESEEELSTPETVLGVTTQIRQLALSELPVWATELWELYAGPATPNEEEREEFVRWVGDNGELVAEQLDWLSE